MTITSAAHLPGVTGQEFLHLRRASHSESGLLNIISVAALSEALAPAGLVSQIRNKNENPRGHSITLSDTNGL